MAVRTSGGSVEMGESALRRSLNARMPVDISNALISASIARCERSRESSWLGFIKISVSLSMRCWLCSSFFFRRFHTFTRTAYNNFRPRLPSLALPTARHRDYFTGSSTGLCKIRLRSSAILSPKSSKAALSTDSVHTMGKDERRWSPRDYMRVQESLARGCI